MRAPPRARHLRVCSIVAGAAQLRLGRRPGLARLFLICPSKAPLNYWLWKFRKALFCQRVNRSFPVDRL
jgi:hypothetical protein